jgi:hypothetical protein
LKSLFLTGYGSIRVKNTRLVFKQGVNDPFRRENEEILEIPASSANFDKVILQGRGYVSTEALERLADSEGNFLDDISAESVIEFLFSKRYEGTWNCRSTTYADA